jgi:hypothetical protein
VIVELEIIEAAEELAGLLEASAEEERNRRRAARRRKAAAAAAALLLLRKKRKRDEALALGLIGQGTDGARAAAYALKPRAARQLRRRVDVSAFGTIGPRGALKDPVEISPGDQLYIARPESPGAGTVSRDPAGVPFAVAGAPLAAGRVALMSVTLMEKLWLTDGNPCEVCEENSIAGWIPITRAFPSGDHEPLAHPNCRCSLEVRRAES